MTDPLICQASVFNANPEVRAGYTTRHLGADYSRLASVLNAPLESLQSLKQIHSDIVHVLAASIGLELLEGDALVATDSTRFIGVRVADCLPLLVYEPSSGLRAAIHAGWRGLVGGIIDTTFEQIRAQGGDVGQALVSLGPCICEKCFEVGPEVAQAFAQKIKNTLGIILPGRGDRSMIDLKKAALEVLKTQGVLEGHVELTPWCTSCQRDLWPSFRKGDQKLRTFAFIGPGC